MPPGRNDPCPCGSGRKYKQCCARAHPPGGPEASAGAFPLAPEAARRARTVPRWEADLLPLPAVVESDPGRPLISLVVTDEAVLDGEISSHTTSDPAALARVLGDALSRAAARAGVWPPTVVLRHREFSDVLVPELAERGAEVVVSRRLEILDEVALGMMSALTEGLPLLPPMAQVEAWAEWGLPERRIADFFRAFARLHRAEPWTLLPEWRPLFVQDAGEEEVVVSVVGGEEPGLVVYSLEDDFHRMMDSLDPVDALGQMEGRVLLLRSCTVHELPPPMQREIARGRWELAGPAAHPLLLPFRTPGGGVSEPSLRRLTAVCDAIADLVEQDREALGSPSFVEFQARGLTLLLTPFEEGTADPSLEALKEEIRSLQLEEGEDPMARIQALFEARNHAPDPELSGLTPHQAGRLLEGRFQEESPLQLATDLQPAELEGARFVQNARLLLSALRETDGTAATTGKNLNRAFVRRMVDEMRFSEEIGRERPEARTLNEEDVFDLHITRVVLELAGLLHRRKGRFVLTRAGAELADPDGIAHLAAKLFRTFFGKFNLAYLDGAEDLPSLQHVLPLALWRVGVEARELAGGRALRGPGPPPGVEQGSPGRTVPGREPRAGIHPTDPPTRGLRPPGIETGGAGGRPPVAVEDRDAGPAALRPDAALRVGRGRPGAMIPRPDEPCPCESGQRYGACCGFGRELLAHAYGETVCLSPGAAWKARGAREWEVDLVPVPAPGVRGGRPVLALVVAGGVVLDARLGECVGWDPDDQARLLEESLIRAAAMVGKWPRNLLLRHREYAEALQGRLNRKSLRVVGGFPLHGLDLAALEWLEFTFEGPPWPPRAQVSRWSEWGLPPERIAEFFGAWARFVQAEPWFLVQEGKSFEVTPPELGRFVSLVGTESPWTGLLLHARQEDFGSLFPRGNVFRPVGSISAVLVLSAGLDDLTPPMQREVFTSGWEVADPEAYPFLYAYGTPGGGIPEPLLRHVTTLCLNLADIAKAQPGPLEGREARDWEARGLRIHLPPDRPGTPALDSLVARLMALAPDVRWDKDRVPTGGEERLVAEETIARIQFWMDDRRRTPQNTLSGLSPRQVVSLLRGRFKEDSPLQVTADLEPEAFAEAPFVHNARLFLSALVETRGTPQTARGNLTRAFVRRIIDEMHFSDLERKAFVPHRSPFNETNIREVHTLRLVLERSGLVERRGRRFVVGESGLKAVRPERAGFLAATIFPTFFEDLDPTLLDEASPLPTLQYVFPLTLWRLGVEARDWLDTRGFADRVVPGTLSATSRDHILNHTLIPVQSRMMWPLIDFGILESRVGRSGNPPLLCQDIEVRVTPLYDRMLRFSWPGGG